MAGLDPAIHLLRMMDHRVTRLSARPVNVDVGVVCLMLGPVGERRHLAKQLAHDLLARADKLMYEAKGERASHIYLLRAKVAKGELVDITDDTQHLLDEVAPEPPVSQPDTGDTNLTR